MEMCGNGERQAHVHTARVALHRRVDELLDLGERHDLVELPFYFGLAHSKDAAVEVDVLAACQVGMKAGANFDQRSDPSPNVKVALGRLGDAGEDLEERCLACAVPADETDDLAGFYLEGDILERPQELTSRRTVARERA